MVFRKMRRLAAAAILTALALSPVFPAGSACFAACGRMPSLASHACCRPARAQAPTAVRGPGCCPPGSASTARVAMTAVEPTVKGGGAPMAASMVATLSAPRTTGDALHRLVRDESPPAPPPLRGILRI